MKTTQEYFKLSIDELLKTNSDGYTKEEAKLFDMGLEIVFYDSIEEMEEDAQELKEYTDKKGYEIKEVLKTINERIAVCLN